MTEIDSVRTDYALTFLVDTARDSDINPDQISKCHGLVADELTRLREENARLRAGFERACQTVYDEIEPTCGQAMAQSAYHAVKTELRAALSVPS